MKQKKYRVLFFVAFLAFAAVCLPQKSFAQCEPPGSFSTAASSLDSGQKLAIETMVADIKLNVTAGVELALASFTTPVVGFIPLWGRAIRVVMRTWADRWIKNALMPGTAQLNTTRVDATRNLGTTIEGENQTKATREIQVREAESVKKYLPNEYTCAADSTARYASQAVYTSRAVENATVTELSDIGLNTQGSAVDDGRAEGLAQRWAAYSANFCNNQANNGAAGCTTALPNAGADVSVAKTLFRKETIDMADPVTALATKELVQNLASFETVDPIPPGTLNSVPGREQMLRQRRLQTQMNAVTGVLAGIVGDRTPGSGTIALEATAERLEAGVPASEISDTPSKRELRQAVIDKLWSAKFYRDLGDEPSTVLQKEVYLKAYSNALLYDLIARTEQVATLFSIQLGNMSDEVGTKSGAIESRPILP